MTPAGISKLWTWILSLPFLGLSFGVSVAAVILIVTAALRRAGWLG